MKVKASKTAQFFKPGARALQWLDSHRLRHEAPWLPIAVTCFLGLAALLWEGVPHALTFLIAFCAILVQAAVSYLQGAERVHGNQMRRRTWNEFASHKLDVAGVTASLGQLLSAKTGKATKVQWRRLQELILDEMVRFVAKARCIADDHVLSANWCMRCETTEPAFKVVVYNRAMADRNPTLAREHPIKEGLLGASGAFLNNRFEFVEDTWAEGMAEQFPAKPPYRQILSIPVTVDCEEVLGVVNLDSSRMGGLTPDARHLVCDLAILVGVCEIMLRDGVAHEAIE